MVSACNHSPSNQCAVVSHHSSTVYGYAKGIILHKWRKWIKRLMVISFPFVLLHDSSSLLSAGFSVWNTAKVTGGSEWIFLALVSVGFCFWGASSMWVAYVMAMREFILLKLDFRFCERFSILGSFGYSGYSFPGMPNWPRGCPSEPFSLVHLQFQPVPWVGEMAVSPT